MELVASAREEQEHVVEGGAPGLGGSADHAEERADLRGHRPEPGADVVDERRDAGDELAEAVLELGAVEAVHDVGQGVRHGASQDLGRGADHAPEVLHRDLELDLKSVELLEEVANLLQRLHEGVAVLERQGGLREGAHSGLELSEPRPSGGIEGAGNAGDDLHGGDADRAKLPHGGGALANPALDVAGVGLDPGVEASHGLGEPCAQIGEDLGALAGQAEERIAQALEALGRVLASLGSVLEEHLDEAVFGRLAEAVGESADVVADLSGPPRHVEVQQGHERLVQRADVVRRRLPDAVGDGAPEVIEILGDVDDMGLVVRVRPGEHPDLEAECGHACRSEEGQLPDLPDVGEDREQRARRTDAGSEGGGQEREVLGQLGHHHVQARQPVDHVAERAPEDADASELADPLDDIVAQVLRVLGDVAELLLEAVQAVLLDAGEDRDDAVPGQYGEPSGHGLGGGLVEVHVQLNGIHLELVASSVQLLLELLVVDLELLDLACAGDALGLELGPLLLELLDLAACVADLLHGLGLSLGALGGALERLAAHLLDLTDEPLLADGLLGHVAGGGGDYAPDLEQLLGELLLALNVSLLLRLELGDRLGCLAHGFAVGRGAVLHDLELALRVLVDLALLLEGGLDLLDALGPLLDRRLVHVDLELQGVGALQCIGRGLEQLRDAVDVLVDLLPVHHEIHVDLEPARAGHATDVLHGPAGVGEHRDLVARAAELPLELLDRTLGVELEQSALALPQLLRELRVELDLLLVGHGLHPPPDIADLGGELSVRRLEGGAELDVILGAVKIRVGLRDQALDLSIELPLVQLHVDLEAEVLQSLQVALSLRREAPSVRHDPDGNLADLSHEISPLAVPPSR